MQGLQASGKKPVEEVEQLRAQRGKLERVSRHITKDKETGSVPKGFGVGVEQARRKTGIDIVGDVAWGTHFCIFYQSKEDLIDILVPYFKAGSENNEFCMWVCWDPLRAEEARASLGKRLKNLDNYIKKGQIEIVDYSRQQTEREDSGFTKMKQFWIDKEKQALERGFTGLRLAGNTYWLEKREWKDFVKYEEEVDEIIRNHKMLAICPYSLDKCGGPEIIDVVGIHKSALIRREGKWESIESSECKKAKEELQKSEIKFRTLVENIPRKVFIKDKNSVYIFCNKNYSDDLKIEPEEIVGKTDYDFYPKELAEKYHSDDKRIIETGKTEDIEEKYIEDGQERWVHTVKTPYKDEKGKAIGVLGTFRDITERKKTDEALSKNIKLLNDTGEMAKVGGWELDLVTKEVSWTEEVAQIHGVDPRYKMSLEEAINFYAPESIPVLEATLKKTIETGEPYDLESLFIPSGSKDKIWVRSLGRAIYSGGKIVKLAGTFQNIDKYKRAEEALKAERQRLHDVLEVMPIMVCLLTPDYHVAFANRAFREKFGESHGRRCYEYCFGKKEPCDFCETYRMLKTAKPHHWQVTTLDGASVIDVYDFPFTDVDGSPMILEMDIDITERKKAEAEARDVQQKLIEQQCYEKEHVNAELAKLHDELVRTTRLAAIGQVSASIAHDLRNPLGAVRNASYFLRRRLSKDEPKASEHLKIIDQEVAKADQIITNLLEMAQPKASHKQVVDLAEIVEQVFGQAKGIEGVRCRTSLVPDPFMVQTDPNQLRQAISNIMSNAVYAMKGHGEFLVEATRDSDYDTLVFRDTGPGFDPEVRDRLFEPLVTTKASGTGLGLTICRQIVEKQGGTIHAEDCKGGGAVIRIRLPRQ